jgi:23S rRNA G2069 N7-methylase RlmK/C1962 C5-methylase RlmI
MGRKCGLPDDYLFITEKQMKISEVEIEKKIMVQTTTDAYRVISNDWSLNRYIEQFGDVEVVHEPNAGSKVCKAYSVPAFKEQRDRYCSAKAADCQQWGCE